MKYKLLVLDVDGTLLNDKKEITPRTHAALLKAQQMGVHVVLASGRPTNGVQPLAEALELNHYGGFILSYNGGQIINAQTGELMFEKRIDPAMIPYLNRKAKENGFAIFTYHKDYILTDSPENKHVQEEAELNKMRIIGVENFPEAVDFAPCKCILTSDDENNLVGLENHWKKRLDGVLEAFRSEDYFLEVAPHFINKGNTLAVLMEMLNITTEEVVAIGDGVADVSMLQLAGTGVAMGNARDSVKACADFTTLSNNMDGVAVAIEKAILATIKPTEVPLDQLNTVMVDGQDIFSLKEEALTIFRRRKIGFVFQAYNLVPVLNVYENIVLPIELDGGKVNKDFVQQIVQTLGLDDRLDALPNQLSGGQQQRVAIARALAAAPAIILADEPTGNLDSKTSQDVLSLLKVTSQKFAQTIVMITHNEEIAQMADRIIRIEDGRIVSQN